MRPVSDLVGKRFGRIVVLREQRCGTWRTFHGLRIPMAVRGHRLKRKKAPAQRTKRQTGAVVDGLRKIPRVLVHLLILRASTGLTERLRW